MPPIQFTIVMAELDPAIHVFVAAKKQDVDARDKPGHDDGTSCEMDSCGQTEINAANKERIA